MKNLPSQLNDLICRDKFFLIAGPCVVENEAITRTVAEQLKEICDKLHIPFIFKASYRKANRTRGNSFSGIGDKEALNIIGQIRHDLNVPTLTDIHQPGEAEMAAGFVDVLQIPAFLCRQTDLLTAAAKTGKAINIKKGQFLSAQSMGFAIEKVKEAGNQKVMLTERGTQFGYGDLIVDYRNIPLMKNFGVPVILDITHSLQQPNTAGGVTGGLPDLIDTIAAAGIAAGADGIFVETHPHPAQALSDGANMIPLHRMEALLEKLLKLKKASDF